MAAEDSSFQNQNTDAEATLIDFFSDDRHDDLHDVLHDDLRDDLHDGLHDVGPRGAFRLTIKGVSRKISICRRDISTHKKEKCSSVL